MSDAQLRIIAESAEDTGGSEESAAMKVLYLLQFVLVLMAVASMGK